ncbi:vacuolar fusion protein CCZ1 homolog isoform X2 [Convolutriloba macropyga]|uniref:vacuolar fusion protein CCZ1 homolog isoform X2 n=1 Tax=Convolutriloba macropyga TaxID=536237 RepID=UPI003F51F228
MTTEMSPSLTTNLTHPDLVNFCILNELYGNKEGHEDERIFHFMPRNTDKSHQINVVGLAQAIIGFTRNFSDEQAEVVTTEKRRQYYFNPEPNFFMVLTMSVPLKDNSPVTVTTPTSGRPSGGGQYDHRKVPDRIYASVLRQAYKAFKFFHGTFTSILQTYGEDKLRASLNFFTTYFERLDFASCDVLTIFEGIKFLPLDRHTYLRVQSFVGSLEHELFTEIGFSGVQVTSFFMYLDFLIWSSLDHTDTQVLYEHMVKKVIPDCMKNELLVTDSMPSPLGQFVYPLYGPDGDQSDINHQFSRFASDDDVLSVHTVYLESSGTTTARKKLAPHWLVIYRAKNMWVCLLIDKASKPELKRDFFRRVDQFLGSRVSELSDDVVVSLESNKMVVPTSMVNQSTTVSAAPLLNPNIPNINSTQSFARSISASYSTANLSSMPSSQTRNTIVASSSNVTLPTTKSTHPIAGGVNSANMHPHLVCYIYFNRMNLATRAQNADRANITNRLASSHDLMLQLCDLHNDLNSQPPHTERDKWNTQSEFVERLAKNSQGYWLYGRISHHREIYMVINNKGKTLREAYDIMGSILESEFKFVFYTADISARRQQQEMNRN